MLAELLSHTFQPTSNSIISLVWLLDPSLVLGWNNRLMDHLHYYSKWRTSPLGYCCLSSCSARFCMSYTTFYKREFHSSREGDLYLSYFSKDQLYSTWTNLLHEVLVLSTAHKWPFSYILPGIQCNSSGGFERGESPNSCYFQPLWPKRFCITSCILCNHHWSLGGAILGFLEVRSHQYSLCGQCLVFRKWITILWTRLGEATIPSFTMCGMTNYFVARLTTDGQPTKDY